MAIGTSDHHGKTHRRSPNGLSCGAARRAHSHRSPTAAREGEQPTFSDYQERFPSYDLDRLRAKLEEPQTAPSASNGDAITLANPSSRIEWEKDLEGQKIQYLGDYELLRFVAKGGMGIVYCARQRSLGRIVAIKLIRAGQFADANEIERFRSEATAAGKLDHPGIVPIYEVGEHEGVPFYSMAFVEGANLATQLAEGPLEPMRAAKLVSQIATAVHYAHSQGIIHRDLKPANILIDNQGQPRITDFGLAKSMQGNSDLTRSGEILGTPSFMPPEQAASQMSAIGPASDVYSLGAILFAILTGRPPFQAATPLETLLQVQKQEAIPIRQLNFNLPRDLETIVLKCLDKSPAKRYPTAQALSEELERFLAGIPILARPVSTTERTLRWCRRNPAVASLSIATVGSLLCVATIAVIAYWRESSLLENQIRLTSSESAARKEEQIAKEKAIGAEKTARSERDRAHQSQESTRLNLYLSDGDRIDRLIAESNFVRAKELLDRQVPSSEDQKDFRSFDWFYRKKLLGEAEFTLRLETPIEVMAVSKDEQSIALGVEGGFVLLFDLSTRKATQLPFQMGEEHWSSLAFSQGSRMIGHGRNGSFKVWDLATRELVVQMQPSKQAFGTPFEKIDFPIPSAVDPVHSRLVGSDDQYLLALWSLDSLRPSPFPYINAGDHRARNRESGIEIANGFVDRIGEGYDWALSQAMERKEYAPTGDRSGSTNASRLGHPVTHLSFHPNGNLLASGHARGEVVAWEIDRILDKQQWNTKLKSSYSLFAQPVLSTAWSKSSKLLAATDGKKIVVLEPMSDKTKLEFEVKTSECVQLSFIDDDRILLGMKSGLVEIWSLAQGLSVKSISTGTLTVTGLAVLAHSNAFVTSNADGTINIHTLPEESPALTPDLADTDKQLRNLTSVPLPRIEHLMGSVSMESGRARTRMIDHPPESFAIAASSIQRPIWRYWMRSLVISSRDSISLACRATRKKPSVSNFYRLPKNC